jgi:hypothetical protein
VFLGQFDDAEYVNMMDAKARVESGDDEKIAQANEEFKSWFDKQVNALSLCPNTNAISLVMNRIIPQMRDKLTIIKATNDTREILDRKLKKAADDAVEQLNINKAQ